MPYKISPTTPHLAYILSLLQDGMSWSEIEQGDLVKLYHGERDVYEWENGGQGLIDKVVSYLNPFMTHCYKNINDYMLSYQPTAQDGIDDWRMRPYWQVMQYPRNVHRVFDLQFVDYSQTWGVYPSEEYFEAVIGSKHLICCKLNGEFRTEMQSKEK